MIVFQTPYILHIFVSFPRLTADAFLNFRSFFFSTRRIFTGFSPFGGELPWLPVVKTHFQFSAVALAEGRQNLKGLPTPEPYPGGAEGLCATK